MLSSREWIFSYIRGFIKGGEYNNIQTRSVECSMRLSVAREFQGGWRGGGKKIRIQVYKI